MSKEDINKDWLLKRNLEDATNEIEEFRHIQADAKEEIYQLREKLSSMEGDLRAAKRDNINMVETNNRLKEQLMDSMHKMNLYKIETESLIKQIDLADAKTREKEDDMRLLEAEFDRKLKLQEERMLMRKSKNEDRDKDEMRRKHYLELEELKMKIDEKNEEADYFKSKNEKLEAEISSLRLGRGDNKRMRELENEIGILKAQLSDAKITTTTNTADMGPEKDLRVKKNLSQDEQVQLQRELQQLDLIVKGYMDENAKSMKKQRTLEERVKDLSKKLEVNENLVKEFQLKALKEREGVFVSEDQEVNMQASNVLGNAQAISKKELQELREKLRELQNEKDSAKKD